MSSSILMKPVTLVDFLRRTADAPENETLELIEGELRSRFITTRSPRHTVSLGRVSQALGNWLDGRTDESGSVNVGEVRCRLCRNPQTIVGIDVALWLGEEFTTPPTDPPLYDAPPVVAVEVLSPSDTHEGIVDKVEILLKYGVRQVWVADPDLRTVTIHRPDREPQFFTASQTLTAEPELPGFAVEVRRLFMAKVLDEPSAP